MLEKLRFDWFQVSLVSMRSGLEFTLVSNDSVSNWIRPSKQQGGNRSSDMEGNFIGNKCVEGESSHYVGFQWQVECHLKQQFSEKGGHWPPG